MIRTRLIRRARASAKPALSAVMQNLLDLEPDEFARMNLGTAYREGWHDCMTAMLDRPLPERPRFPREAQKAPSEQGLSQLMRDPRYWRDRDPEIVQRVTDGFRRLYQQEKGDG